MLFSLSHNLNLSDCFFLVTFKLNIFAQNTSHIDDVIHFPVHRVRRHLTSGEGGVYQISALEEYLNSLIDKSCEVIP